MLSHVLCQHTNHWLLYCPFVRWVCKVWERWCGAASFGLFRVVRWQLKCDITFLTLCAFPVRKDRHPTPYPLTVDCIQESEQEPMRKERPPPPNLTYERGCGLWWGFHIFHAWKCEEKSLWKCSLRTVLVSRRGCFLLFFVRAHIVRIMVEGICMVPIFHTCWDPGALYNSTNHSLTNM